MTKSKPRIVILDDVCDEITVGHVGPMADKYLPDGVPFLRSQNVRPFRFDPKEIKYVSPEFHSKLKKSALKPNDVVVTRTGANVGQCCIIPKELPVANCSDLVILRASKELAPHYLMYLLNSPHGRASIDGDLAGAAQPHFNVGSAKRMEVILPDLSTQRKIASILSAYDDLIENNLRRIKILEEMARSLYREWFVHFAFPGHEAVPLIESPLGPIPKGWAVRSVDDVAIVHRGRSYRSKELLDEVGVPFVSLKCIERDGGFRRDGIKCFDGPYKKTQQVQVGDIVMAVTDMTQERRIVARAARVPELGGGFGVISMDLVKIEARDAKISDFLYFYLRCSDFADHLKQYANGANVLHLSPDKIRGHLFVMPTIEFALRYVRVVDLQFAKVENLHQRNEILRQTRDLLLPKLLSGA